jgi:hypothetical protein
MQTTGRIKTCGLVSDAAFMRVVKVLFVGVNLLMRKSYQTLLQTAVYG